MGSTAFHLVGYSTSAGRVWAEACDAEDGVVGFQPWHPASLAGGHYVPLSDDAQGTSIHENVCGHRHTGYLGNIDGIFCRSVIFAVPHSW